MMAAMFEKMVHDQEAQDLRRQIISQKDAAAMLEAVPSVAPKGVVLSGSKLLAWFREIVLTYLEERYWTSQFAFNALQKLFADAPALLATWRQVTQSDERVIALREEGRWKEAWTHAADAIIAAHVGDRHQEQRKRLKPAAHLRQTDDMTVATTATVHLEDVQSREVLGLWDGIASLVRDLEQNALHSRHGISVLGIDLSCREGRKHHQRIMSVLHSYRDCQRALELYGALQEDHQTHLEDKMGKELLPSEGTPTATLAEVRACAQNYEAREHVRVQDTGRQLRSLGISVPKTPRSGARLAAVHQLSDSDEEGTSSDDRSDNETDADGAGGGVDHPDAKKEGKASPKASNSIDLDALFKAFAAFNAAGTECEKDLEELDQDAARCFGHHLRRSRFDRQVQRGLEVTEVTPDTCRAQ